MHWDFERRTQRSKANTHGNWPHTLESGGCRTWHVLHTVLFVQAPVRHPQLATLTYPLPMPGTQEEGMMEEMEAEEEEGRRRRIEEDSRGGGGGRM